MKKKQNKKDPSSNQSNVSDDQPISNSKQSLPDSPELSKSETQVTNSEHIIEQSSNETQQIKEEKEIIHPDLSIDEKVKFESTKATNVDKIPTSSTASGWTLSGVVENVNVTDQIQQPLMQIHEIGNPLLGFRRTFPALLFKILLMQHDPSILDWMPDGKSFVIKKPALFAQFIAPQYFNHCRYESFQRQLNLYGFRRDASNPDLEGAYFHQFFVRESPHLLSSIQRMNKLSDEHDSLMVSGSKVSPSVGTAKRSRSEPIPKSSFKVDYVRGQEFISSRNASYGNPPMSQADFGSSGHRPTSRTTSSVESIHMPVYYQQQSSSFHSGYSDTRFNSSLGCQLGGSSSQILSESQHLGSSSSSSYEAFLSGNTSGGRSPGQHPSNYFESQQRSNNNEEEEEEEEDEIISHIRKHAPASDF